MSAGVIACQWDGETFKPLRRFNNVCAANFTIGAIYNLEQIQERSAKTHAHYFACLHDAWLSLPDDFAEEYPDEETLRKKALIRTGYRDERSIVCASKAEAQRVAAFVRPMDRYAIVVVSEAVVRVWTAKSQSLKAMGKIEFAASKQAVLDFVSSLIGVEPSMLDKNAGAAA